MDSKVPGLSSEQPLHGSARFFLLTVALLAVLGLYLFFVIAMLLMLVVIAVDSVLFVILLRVGLAGRAGRLLAQHGEILTAFGRSLLLKPPIEARLALKPVEAPRLFEILEDLSARSKVPVPEEVSVELSTNAWVKLPGFRRGGGGTRLGIGYDLMAGLTEQEIRGILAHEISHARLVDRGFKRWMGQGLSRASQLATALCQLRERFDRAQRPSILGRWLFRVADKIGRTIARLFAAGSRQDEYEADRGAAELCGGDVLRSSLLKMEGLHQRSSRLPWNERQARLQQPGSFSRWLIGELTTPLPASIQEAADLFDAYATHPSLPNRLKAIPPSNPAVTDTSGPGLRLLADPDAVAERLMVEIQKIAAIYEEKDEQQLRRWLRTKRRGAPPTALQGLGMILLIGGILGFPVIWFAEAMNWLVAAVVMAVIGLGWVCFHFGRRRERLALPIPEYAEIRQAMMDQRSVTQEVVAALEKEIQGLFPEIKSGRKRALRLAEEAYTALGKCDFLRARVAVMLCLREESASREGHLALAVSAAARRENDLSAQALVFLQGQVNITQGSWAWGTAWALVLLGDWGAAEAMLLNLLKQNPGQATFFALLALCQWRRGKSQSAIVAARKAIALRPEDEVLRIFLVDLLTSAGFLREASVHLGPSEEWRTRTEERMIAQLRIRLLMQDWEGAEVWVTELVQGEEMARRAVQVAALLEQARRSDRARELYQKALEAGHYPEARLGLARLHALEKDLVAAREQLRLALDILTPPVTGSSGTGALFGSIMAQWRALENPLPRCRVWNAVVHRENTPQVVAGLRVQVYARDHDEARERFDVVLAALRPNQPPLLPGLISWEEVAPELQPDRPTQPGVLLA